MQRRTIHAWLSLDGEPLHTVACSLTEGLSLVSHGQLEVASRSDIDVAAAIGQEAKLVLEVDGVAVRSLSVLVGRGGFSRIEQGSLRFQFELFSPFWRLRHTRDLRKYRNMSAKQIVSDVLGRGGVAHEWQLVREPPVRKYCVQYRESDFDFVNRLLEFEGIHFQCRDDGSLLLSDASVAAPFVSGETTFRLLGNAGGLEGEIGIHRFSRGARVSTGKVTLNDYNWKTPRVSLLSTSAAEHDAELEVYDFPSGFRKPEDGAAMAQRRLEAHRCNSRFVQGASNVPYFSAGRRFQYEGLNAGEYLLTRVTHEVHDEAYRREQEGEGDETLYRNQFEAIPSEVPFRPALATPRPVVQGAHTAMVRGPAGEEIHTDRYGRFRAQFHWDRQATASDEDSRWLRKLQESATGANLARVGWEVSVAYVDGDPDRPIGLARNINGVKTPTYAQPAEKQLMTIRTPTYPSNGGYNEVTLDDRAGAMLIDVRAERDLMNIVKNDKTETILNDDTRRIDLNLNRRVMRDQQLKIGADRVTTVGGGHSGKVEGNRSDSIGGNEVVKAATSAAISVGASDTESVGSLRFTFAGSIAPPDIAANAKSLIPKPPDAKSVASSLAGGGGGGLSAPSLPSAGEAANTITGGLSSGDLTSLFRGNIGRTAETIYSRTVGGAKIAVAGNNIGNDAGYVLVETVGGAKITVAKGAIRQAVGGPCVSTVGGALFRTCTGDMGVGAKNSTVTAGISISLESAEKLEVHGKTIRLEASSTLKLAVGADLALEMTPSSIAFVGPMIAKAGTEVSIDAPDDNISEEAAQ